MNQDSDWSLILFAAGGFLLLIGFWAWTTRKKNTKGK